MQSDVKPKPHRTKKYLKQEDANEKVKISFSFKYDWLRKFRELSEPIIEQNQGKDNHQAFPGYFWHSFENFYFKKET